MDYFFNIRLWQSFIVFAITEDGNVSEDDKTEDDRNLLIMNWGWQNCKALQTLLGQYFRSINSMPSLRLSLCMIRNVVWQIFYQQKLSYRNRSLKVQGARITRIEGNFYRKYQFYLYI